MFQGAWYRVRVKLITMPLPLKIFMLLMLAGYIWGAWKVQQENEERRAEWLKTHHSNGIEAR